MASRGRLARALAGTLALAASALGVVAVGALGAQPAAAAVKAPVLGIATGGDFQFQTVAKQEAYLSAAHDLGATWLRFDFTWNDIQRSNASTYDFARYEALVARAKAHGLQVVGMIGYAPTWARDPQCVSQAYCRPRDPGEYGTFAGQVAKRFAPLGVHHWEIWNEPNLAQYFRPGSDPTYYARMLSSAYRAIHAADPAASVLAGSTAPAPSAGGDLTPVDFVSRMYNSPGGSDFDILAHHPYCYAGTYDCPGKDANWSAWSQMSWTPVNLRSLMSAHGGAGKQIWATEFGAPTGGDPTAVTEAHQASMLATAVEKFAGYSWSGPLFIFGLQDRGTNPGVKDDWFGMLRADGSRKPSYGQVNNALRSLAPTGPAPTAAATPAPTPTPPPVATVVPTPAPTTPAPVVPAPGPALGSVSPARGPLAGGTQVTLTGSNLAGRSGIVRFGDQAVALQAVNATTVRAITPRGTKAGTVAVTVVIDGQASVLPGAFRYQSKRLPWWQRALNRVF